MEISETVQRPGWVLIAFFFNVRIKARQYSMCLVVCSPSVFLFFLTAEGKVDLCKAEIHQLRVLAFWTRASFKVGIFVWLPECCLQKHIAGWLLVVPSKAGKGQSSQVV